MGGGSRGKLKLGLGAKTFWGKGSHPCDTARNLACQRLSEAWGWEQLASSELVPVTPPQHCWQAVNKIKTRQK